MNNLPQFTIKKNINMLWEVLLDELNINQENKPMMTNIRAVFESNINPFLARANVTSGLLNLNKLFLSQVLTAVNRLFPNLHQEKQMKLINISNETIEEPYKVEDIHNARQTDFEKQVNQRRSDFEDLVTIKKPKEVDFSDKAENSKIKEMEALIAETIAKRNFDIEQIHTNTNNNTNNSINSDDWLKSNDTSVRVEKQQPINNDNQRKHKYVNVETSLINSPKKVSFNEDNNMTIVIEELPTNADITKDITKDITTNIFNKLKKVETNTNTNSIQSQIADLNQKVNTLFSMMEQMSNNINKIVNAKNE